MNLHWFSLDVLAVLVVQALLGNLADIDFWVEVCRECLVVIAGVAVNDEAFEVKLGGNTHIHILIERIEVGDERTG